MNNDSPADINTPPKVIPSFSSILLLATGLVIGVAGCNREKKADPLFERVPATVTGVTFENTLTENDDFNIIEYLYYFNGGGVAAGDINNDGLADLYFSSNQQANRLYLNKGNFQFEDITATARVAGTGNWKTGVTMADVNGDGLLDIYLCGVGGYKKFDTRNQLFINNGDLTFTERASAYGLDFKGLSTQSSFFDYDNDGDLDMYLLNHSVHSVRTYGNATSRNDKDPMAGDRLYRNDSENGVVKFVNVTGEAGIYNSQIGYGLGIATSDINMDGLMDIYVSNDFRENDYLYLNSGDGTFREELEEMLGHTSRFSMGNDVADFNNDALPDILTVDMMPDEEKIIKASVGEDSYEIYKYKLNAGYHFQVARNALQLNLGNGHFSDIAWLSGVAATDWSWAPLMADFDNDGFKDLFISNGVVRRPNDLDYLNFISSDSARALSDIALARKMPEGKAVNHLFKNSGILSFIDKSKEWGLELPSNSNGAVYADLDNDGDLDLAINNINQQAFLYRNTLHDTTRQYIQIRFRGKAPNTFGIGTKVFAFVNGSKIYQEQAPTRGYESSVEYVLTMGLGNVKRIDSLWVIWPDRKWEVIRNLASGQRIELDYKNALRLFDYNLLKSEPALLKETSTEISPPYIHRENDFVDFNREGLMPHMLSAEGPRMAAGDVNKDGLEDFFIGGAKGQPGFLYLGLGNGGFKASNEKLFQQDALAEDTGAAFFDADGDGDLDLIAVSGGNEEIRSVAIQPRLYINDGKGNFSSASGRLPEIYINASCVKAGDLDGDGDLDLFIGGRVVPDHYGVSPASFILANEGQGIFKDVSSGVLAGGQAIGMITDAAWTDLNKDHRMDLIVVGEWMSPTVLIQDMKGKLVDQSNELGLDSMNGWWNAVSVADFDRDGDLDFVAGNLGLNSRLKASNTEPVEMFVGDFDNNGSTEQILTYFNQGVSYPFVSRDQLVKQIPPLRKKFLKYQNYVKAGIDDVISPEQQATAEKKYACRFQSTYFENVMGQFRSRDLPLPAQFFPIVALRVADINGDGNLDLLAVGNRYATQPDMGRYDAGYGLIMTGNGNGKFRALNPAETGFLVLGEGRDIQILSAAKGEKIYLVSRNNDSVIAFKPVIQNKGL